MKRLTSLCSMFLAVILLVSTISAPRVNAIDLSEESVRSTLLAFQEQYPEGTPFDTFNVYAWHGGIYQIGTGCAAFAFILSDAAFGSLPARKYYDYSQIRVGDILRMNNDEHSVIVIDVHANSIIVAEGNLNGKVHWGREIPLSPVHNQEIVYAMTRYPEDMPPPVSIKGDANDDKLVSIEDAQLVLQSYAQMLSGLPPTLSEKQLSNVDIDGDKQVNILDAQYILIYYSENTLANQPCTWEQVIARK